jgi:hypothetical protein
MKMVAAQQRTDEQKAARRADDVEAAQGVVEPVRGSRNIGAQIG